MEGVQTGYITEYVANKETWKLLPKFTGLILPKLKTGTR